MDATLINRALFELEKIAGDTSRHLYDRNMEVYRQELRERVPRLLAIWQPKLGVQAAGWGIKKMKTKWGSYSNKTRRIWLNLELAKKPERCLEYIVVHELTHLRHRRHDEEFTSILDRHLPGWRRTRKELNAGPLSADKRSQ